MPYILAVDPHLVMNSNKKLSLDLPGPLMVRL
jgi:hypothetical protein